ncbi:MAG TPA: XdhC family protein, partial [Tepidisphaeraceae bacterium]
AISLVNIAAEAGCAVTIVTHRPGQASAAQFNAARRRMDLQPSEIAARLTISNRTAAVVMTHDFETDLALLPALLDSPASYIGLLGPKARTARLLTDLHQRGRRLTPTDIARLRTPVGLDIGSITPQEIALSIVSEIIAVRNGRSGTPLRDREVTRHEPYRRDGMIELPSGVIVD